MNKLKQYHVLIKNISKIRIIILLTGLIVLINFVIFPLLNTKEVKPLDTRFYYSHEEAADYHSQLEENDKIKSIIMHGTVDLIYPIIYTLLFSCIIIYLKGGPLLTALPLLTLAADIFENIFIILILSISQQNPLYTTLKIVASIITPLKWCFILISICVIIYLSIRRVYEK
jgi:hypothetical protein